MSKYFLPIFFIVFFLFIGLPMVLSNEPEPDIKCHEMTHSPQFTAMIKKLHRQVPIEKSIYRKVWNDNGVVNYSELLIEMKSLVTTVKNVKKIINGQIEEPIHNDDLRNAEHFLDTTHKDFVKILDDKCGTEDGLQVFIPSDIVEEVLYEVLECAVAVHEFVKQEKDHKTGLFDKFNKWMKKQKWTKVDKEFESALKTIWVLSEPTQLYEHCNELAESTKFNTIIHKLQKKIPIKKGDSDDILNLNAEGKMNYHKLLPAIIHFFLKMEFVEKNINKTAWAVENEYVMTTNKYKHLHPEILKKSEVRKNFNLGQLDSTHWAVENGYVVITYKYKTFEAFRKALDENNGLIAGSILEIGLGCARRIHEFIEQMATLKKGGYPQSPKNNWTKLNGKFEAELQKIWMLKTEDTDKMATAEEVDDRVNVKKEKIAAEEGANAHSNVKH